MKVKLIEYVERQELYESSIGTRARLKRDSDSLPSNLKSLHINELRFNGLNYLSLKLEAAYKSTIQVEYTQAGYLACFVLQGECNLVGKNINSSIAINHYTCLPVEKPLSITVSSITRILFINIDQERIQGFSINNRQPKKLLSPMNGILSEIQQCTEDCPIQCIFIESKILSLLYMAFEEFDKNDYPVKDQLAIELSKKDMQKLRAAKVYIVQNISKNYTLIELAHQVGLNDFKLKKGFKELFGSTVFTYRHSIRMEKAKDMLKSGYQVNEVSEEIGYKHPHHFSTAFKEYFAILPSKIKQNS